jgi:hypothetical protein
MGGIGVILGERRSLELGPAVYRRRTNSSTVNPMSFAICRKQDRRYIPAPMIRYRRVPAVGMPKLLMRSALADFGKTQSLQNGYDFSRFENRDLAHVQPTVTV